MQIKLSNKAVWKQQYGKLKDTILCFSSVFQDKIFDISQSEAFLAHVHTVHLTEAFGAQNI